MLKRVLQGLYDKACLAACLWAFAGLWGCAAGQKADTVLVLQPDMALYVKNLARAQAIDSVFERVIGATARGMESGDQPVMKIFTAQFDSIARPLGRTLGTYFDAGTLGASAAGGEAALTAGLRARVDSVLPVTMRTLRRRLESAGVFLGKMTRRGTNQLVLEIAGKDVPALHSLFTVQGDLEFTLVRDDSSAAGILRSIDRAITGGSDRPASDSMPAVTLTDSARAAVYRVRHPLSSQCLMMVLSGRPGEKPQYVDMTAEVLPSGQYSFNVLYGKVPEIMKLLARPEARGALPPDVVIAFGIPASVNAPGSDVDGDQLCQMYILNATPEMSGEIVADARSEKSKTGQFVVNVTMNEGSGTRWEKVTGGNLNRRLAIVLDKRVYSAPQIMGKISGGNLQISVGNAPDAGDAAALLAVALKMGGLPAPLKIVEEHLIKEPT